MSHIVTIETEVRDAAAVQAACERLKLPAPVAWAPQALQRNGPRPGRAASRLEYPAVCNLTTGKIEFDNYGGRWGDQEELDRFLQAYAVEKAKIEARRKGYSVTEQPWPMGRSSSPSRSEVPHEDDRNHRHSQWPDQRRNQGLYRQPNAGRPANSSRRPSGDGRASSSPASSTLRKVEPQRLQEGT